MEAVDQHRHSLDPFFYVVPFAVVELAAQFLLCEGSQVAATIDEKLGVRNLVVLGESVQECRPQKSAISDVRLRTAFSLTPRGQSRGD